MTIRIKKMTIRTQSPPVRRATIKNLQTINAGQQLEGRECLSSVLVKDNGNTHSDRLQMPEKKLSRELTLGSAPIFPDRKYRKLDSHVQIYAFIFSYRKYKKFYFQIGNIKNQFLHMGICTYTFLQEIQKILFSHMEICAHVFIYEVQKS